MSEPIRVVILVTGGNDPQQTESAVEWKDGDPAELPAGLVFQAAEEVRRRRAPKVSKEPG